ncbi:MAG: hypothetical protein GY862_04400 [Gammaproteobacteria bacterium]|nr:hypothetical protein [Gammaproteobacteria bacterium]
MKKTNKPAAMIAAALSAAVVAPPIYAGNCPNNVREPASCIEFRHNGTGDALIFPAFAIGGGAENYFTISSASSYWIQGHIRFRGAAWGSELLSFDVILSPKDTFVFRLSDLDGDGLWEIDQSLDPDNFAYTSLTRGCSGAAVRDNCMDVNITLEPDVSSVLPDGTVTPGVPLEIIDNNRNTRGINFTAAHPHPITRGVSSAILDTAVILHNEDSAIADDQYVYRFDDVAGDGGVFEQRVSYNNIWGPTLADGDDYNLQTRAVDLLGITDDYDLRYINVNSVAEVEEAIRADGQIYSSHFFHNDRFDKTGAGGNEGDLANTSVLNSILLALFPTKFYSAEQGKVTADTLREYINIKVNYLVNTTKLVTCNFCDNFGTCFGDDTPESGVGIPVTPVYITSLARKLLIFDIPFFFKGLDRSGRFEIMPFASYNNPQSFPLQSWPMLFYTFEVSAEGNILGHWRNMWR